MAEEYESVEKYKKLFEEARSSRGKLEKDWYMNLSYYMGDQWIYWNKGRITTPKLENWRVKFTDNRILPAVTIRAAKKTKNRPTFVCTPATSDEDDMSNAEIGEKILRNDWNQLNLDEKHLLAEWWAEICGAGFWKIFWDSTAGDKRPFLTIDGEIHKTENGAPVPADEEQSEQLMQIAQQAGLPVGVQEVATGDMCVEVITPFEVFPDPLATSMSECEWVIEEKIRSIDYMKRTYGQDLKPDATVPVGIVESRRFATDKDSPKGVKVYEYFCKPNAEYPNGKWVIWANDKVLVSKDNIEESPYAEFPYVMFTGQIIPGRFWPTSVVTQLRGPQTDLNKLQSQIRENAIRIGNPAVAVSREANVKWKGGIGEVVKFSDVVQNPLPTFIQPPEIPVYVREEIERIEKSIVEISGIHDISQGSVPTGITAASAINLLQEADDTRLGPEIQLMERSLALAGHYILKLRAKWTSDKRLIRLAGEDGGWDIFSFKGDMLEKIINVEVQAGSGMPTSKAARQAAMQELLNLALQYGVPLNPRSMRQFFRDYEMGGLDKLFQDIQNDEYQINRENRRLYSGEMFGINDFDNDDLHIEGHQEEMKTAKWEKLDDAGKGKFLAHTKLHIERRQTAINAQVEAARQEQMQAALGEHASEMQQIEEKNKGKEENKGNEE